MTDEKSHYTGTLRRGIEPNTVVGHLVDRWNWRIDLFGTRAEDGSYTLTGTLGEVPDALRIPAIDGEKPEPTSR